MLNSIFDQMNYVICELVVGFSDGRRVLTGVGDWGDLLLPPSKKKVSSFHFRPSTAKLVFTLKMESRS